MHHTTSNSKDCKSKKRYPFNVRRLQHIGIPRPTRKENVWFFKNLSCKTWRITRTIGGEGKDQQEALNLQQIKCKQFGGPSKLQIHPFSYGNEIQRWSHWCQ